MTRSRAANTAAASRAANESHDLVEQCSGGVAEQGDRSGVRDGGAVGSRDQLIEQREGVAHRPSPGSDDEREDAGLGVDPLVGAESLHVVEHLRRRHEAERVVVGSTADRADDLLGLGRREDELDVLGRLLDELEQRVEARRGDHVRFVEDEDLESVARGGERRALAQVAGVVDAVVGRGVDLDDVEGPAAVSREFDARRAGAARVSVGPSAQLRQRARMRALVVLPQPRGPENRYA